MEVPVEAGQILAGKYRVERVLGRGGMGVVVAARHIELDDLVALKFLLPEALGSEEAVARFLREARASVRIKSEHVARVHDVGTLETGAPYIVMEYLEGSDLAALLRARGPRPVEEVVDFVTQACEAMAGAHVLGIVHRDLKPSNLMVVRRNDGSECVKVLDFGISKVSGGGGRMTQSLAVLGSPSYMSPEQMMSTRDVDARTDIWSMGAILYELLTGELPFVGETLPALGMVIATQEPTPIRSYRSDVPPGVEAVIARCLAKRADQRFQNVGELAAALAPFAPPRALVSIERARRVSASSAQSAPASGGAGSGPIGTVPAPAGQTTPFPNDGRMTPGSGQLPPGNGQPTPGSGRLTPGSFGSQNSGDRTMTATPFPSSSGTNSSWANGGARPGAGTRRAVAIVVGATLVSIAGLGSIFLLRGRLGGTTSAQDAPHAGAPAPSAPITTATPPSSAGPSSLPPPAVSSLPPPASPEQGVSVAPKSAVDVGGPSATPSSKATGKNAPAHVTPPPVPPIARANPPATATQTPKKSAYDDM
ncbi:MAG TPA: protein kinase [Polyangiaceae bacterium]|jgi:serine/threonine-protein kinase|nr:protein kinase [Polyangiaceae bacterium]